ncbi:MAG TPA: VIT1/CCC1 transporter family protein [Polyangiaceae bacterium]|jgi:VIT1/CCC1 family predicted Fe2+/Mn2+ transporter
MTSETGSRARHYHDVLDAHRTGGRLVNVLLGGQDGLVNVLGVVLGVAAATHSTRVVLAAAIAAAVAESISMAAVAFTTSRAAAERFESERRRERRHIDRVPDLERDEIRALYAARGFSGELLDRVVETLTRDKDVWLAVMMREEHELHDVDRAASLRSAIEVGVAALVGSLLPVVPYAFAPVGLATPLALIVGAATLFAFGCYKAHVTVGSVWRSGATLTLIGMASALAGYAVGTILHV